MPKKKKERSDEVKKEIQEEFEKKAAKLRKADIEEENPAHKDYEGEHDPDRSLNPDRAC